MESAIGSIHFLFAVDSHRRMQLQFACRKVAFFFSLSLSLFPPAISSSFFISNKPIKVFELMFIFPLNFFGFFFGFCSLAGKSPRSVWVCTVCTVCFWGIFALVLSPRTECVGV